MGITDWLMVGPHNWCCVWQTVPAWVATQSPTSATNNEIPSHHVFPFIPHNVPIVFSSNDNNDMFVSLANTNNVFFGGLDNYKVKVEMSQQHYPGLPCGGS